MPVSEAVAREVPVRVALGAGIRAPLDVVHPEVASVFMYRRQTPPEGTYHTTGSPEAIRNVVTYYLAALETCV
jgi:hypothetical protein